MSKLIALYKTPPDPAVFDEAYFNTHLPLLNKVPGLESTEISRFTRTIMGDSYYMVAIMSFRDQDALKSAMRSPEMTLAGENLNSFASGLVTLSYAEDV